ncbi:MAG: hypothetical protein VX554_02455, partial [Candidatus Thermoplasmatota archaeon]|nr:hypothetical protein [Candidatus Thermoplasmatota archaeon]
AVLGGCPNLEAVVRDAAVEISASDSAETGSWVSELSELAPKQLVYGEGSEEGSLGSAVGTGAAADLAGEGAALVSGKDTSSNVSEAAVQPTPHIPPEAAVVPTRMEDVIFKCLEEDAPEAAARCKAFRVRQKYNKTDDLDVHSLTHYPPMAPGECAGCDAARLTRADQVREVAVLLPDGGRDLFLADFAGPMSTSSNGSRWLLMLRWIKDGETMPFRTEPVATRESDEALDALHEMRVEFGREGKPFELKCDYEGAFRSEEAKTYFRRHAGVPHYSIPHRSTTKASIESAVRYAKQGIAATLRASACPYRWWHHACRTWWVHYAAVHCAQDVRLNQVPKKIPFCSLGYTVLPKAVLKRGLKPRAVPVAFLEYVNETRTGILVAFRGTNGKFRKTRIMARDVVWSGDLAFTFELRELAEKTKLHKDWLETDESSSVDTDDVDDTSDEDLSEQDDDWLEANVVSLSADVSEGQARPSVPRGRADGRVAPDTTAGVELDWEPPVAEAKADANAPRKGAYQPPKVRNSNRTPRRTRQNKRQRLCRRAQIVLRTAFMSEANHFTLDETELEQGLDDMLRIEQVERLVRAADPMCHGPRAYVTRLCTAQEKKSDEGVKANQEEMSKIITQFAALTEPATREEVVAAYPEATVSGVNMITSIK